MIISEEEDSNIYPISDLLVSDSQKSSSDK